MAYTRCVLDAKENERVIVQNGQRKIPAAQSVIYRSYHSYLSRSALLLHLVLFLVRQSSVFLFVHTFAFEEGQTVNRER